MGKHIKKDRKRRGEVEATWAMRQKRKSVRKDGRGQRKEEKNRWKDYQGNKKIGKKNRVGVKVLKKVTALGIKTVKSGKVWGAERMFVKALESERRGSRTRIQNRCVETGYSRSVQRWFRRSGRRRREKARRGELPSVTSRSW